MVRICLYVNVGVAQLMIVGEWSLGHGCVVDGSSAMMDS